MKFRFSMKQQAGGALASLLTGLLVHVFERWDVVFYFLTCILAIWGVLFVCKMKIQQIFYDQKLPTGI